MQLGANPDVALTEVMSKVQQVRSRLPAEAGKMVVIDGVFSMSGDIARLPDLMAVAEEFGAKFYVDEAHALGVIGPDGKGSAHHTGTADRADLMMGNDEWGATWIAGHRAKQAAAQAAEAAAQA